MPAFDCGGLSKAKLPEHICTRVVRVETDAVGPAIEGVFEAAFE
ncbi:hypothetical protein [Haladaptatus sp. GCM10025893]